MEKIPCKKCLLKDLDKDEYFSNVYEYIENLDEGLKVSDEVYKNRLNECTNCDNLINGMCKHCGCFVEMRAVMKNKSCPDINSRW